MGALVSLDEDYGDEFGDPTHRDADHAPRAPQTSKPGERLSHQQRRYGTRSHPTSRSQLHHHDTIQDRTRALRNLHVQAQGSALTPPQRKQTKAQRICQTNPNQAISSTMVREDGVLISAGSGDRWTTAHRPRNELMGRYTAENGDGEDDVYGDDESDNDHDDTGSGLEWSIHEQARQSRDGEDGRDGGVRGGRAGAGQSEGHMLTQLLLPKGKGSHKGLDGPLVLPPPSQTSRRPSVSISSNENVIHVPDLDIFGPLFGGGSTSSVIPSTRPALSVHEVGPNSIHYKSKLHTQQPRREPGSQALKQPQEAVPRRIHSSSRIAVSQQERDAYLETIRRMKRDTTTHVNLANDDCLRRKREDGTRECAGTLNNGRRDHADTHSLLQPDRETSSEPVINVLWNQINAPTPTSSRPGVRVHVEDGVKGGMKAKMAAQLSSSRQHLSSDQPFASSFPHGHLLRDSVLLPDVGPLVHSVESDGSKASVPLSTPSITKHPLQSLPTSSTNTPSTSVSNPYGTIPLTCTCAQQHATSLPAPSFSSSQGLPPKIPSSAPSVVSLSQRDHPQRDLPQGKVDGRALSASWLRMALNVSEHQPQMNSLPLTPLALTSHSSTASSLPFGHEGKDVQTMSIAPAVITDTSSHTSSHTSTRMTTDGSTELSVRVITTQAQSRPQGHESACRCIHAPQGTLHIQQQQRQTGQPPQKELQQEQGHNRHQSSDVDHLRQDHDEAKPSTSTPTTNTLSTSTSSLPPPPGNPSIPPPPLATPSLLPPPPPSSSVLPPPPLPPPPPPGLCAISLPPPPGTSMSLPPPPGSSGLVLPPPPSTGGLFPPPPGVSRESSMTSQSSGPKVKKLQWARLDKVGKDGLEGTVWSSAMGDEGKGQSVGMGEKGNSGRGGRGSAEGETNGYKNKDGTNKVNDGSYGNNNTTRDNNDGNNDDDEASLQINADDLVSKFAVDERASGTLSKSTNGPSRARTQVLTCLPSSSSRQIEIILNAARLTPTRLRTAILSVEENVLSTPLLVAMANSVPDLDTWSRLKELAERVKVLNRSGTNEADGKEQGGSTGGKDDDQSKRAVKAKLGAVEETFLALENVPDLRGRLCAIRDTQSETGLESLRDIDVRLDKVISACATLRTSKYLRTVLSVILRVGNLLNSDRAAGFHLSSLTKLASYRASKGAETEVPSLLHYIVTFLHQNRPKCVDFVKDLGILARDTAKIDVEALLKETISIESTLRSTAKVITSSLSSPSVAPSPPPSPSPSPSPSSSLAASSPSPSLSTVNTTSIDLGQSPSSSLFNTKINDRAFLLAMAYLQTARRCIDAVNEVVATCRYFGVGATVSLIDTHAFDTNPSTNASDKKCAVTLIHSIPRLSSCLAFKKQGSNDGQSPGDGMAFHEIMELFELFAKQFEGAERDLAYIEKRREEEKARAMRKDQVENRGGKTNGKVEASRKGEGKKGGEHGGRELNDERPIRERLLAEVREARGSASRRVIVSIESALVPKQALPDIPCGRTCSTETPRRNTEAHSIPREGENGPKTTSLLGGLHPSTQQTSATIGRTSPQTTVLTTTPIKYKSQQDSVSHQRIEKWTPVSDGNKALIRTPPVHIHTSTNRVEGEGGQGKGLTTTPISMKVKVHNQQPNPNGRFPLTPLTSTVTSNQTATPAKTPSKTPTKTPIKSLLPSPHLRAPPGPSLFSSSSSSSTIKSSTTGMKTDLPKGSTSLRHPRHPPAAIDGIYGPLQRQRVQFEDENENGNVGEDNSSSSQIGGWFNWW